MSLKLERFAEVYNDIENYPQIADVSNELGVSKQTIKNKATTIRNKKADGHEVPHLISRANVPMSEDEGKFMEHWTAEDCKNELVRIFKLDTDKIVTRNYFRVNSAISEATWNRYFGTFEEFKRQAGIQLTRQQAGLERAIAKHASVDHYRRINIERLDWAETYTRENGNRFKTILMCSDLHDIEIDPFYLRVLIDTAKRCQPDVVCFAGDIFDLAEFGKYGVDPREWDVVGRIKFVHENIFKPMREACPDAQFDLVEGNHENRLMRHMADATPALRAVLSDLHGFTVGKLLGLEQFEINYIAMSNLAAFTKAESNRELQRNYKIYWGSVMAHHFPHGRNMGLPGVNGHHHKHQVWPMFSPIFGGYEWHQLGAGHVRRASYCEGERWHNGFALCNLDTKTKSTVMDYVAITDFAVSGGKWYHREKVEDYMK
jgi:hypothetical protein